MDQTSKRPESKVTALRSTVEDNRVQGAQGRAGNMRGGGGGAAAADGEHGFAGFPRIRSEDFKIIGRFGQGSFANVYKARHNPSGRTVALKISRPRSDFAAIMEDHPDDGLPPFDYNDVILTMQQELEFLEFTGYHPNVVQVLGSCTDGTIFAMEAGETDLYNLVKTRHSELPLDVIWSWTGQLLSSVRHMHAVGLVHQDIKSSNVLIQRDGTVRMCDFGLARYAGSAAMVVDRELVTLWYRSPELLMGTKTYTNKVDLWGTGCMVLEMLTGAPPFRGRVDAVCTCKSVLHRNWNSDQLMKIFTLLGTPKDREFMRKMSCWEHFSTWPLFASKLPKQVKAAVLAKAGDGGGEEEGGTGGVADDWTAWHDLLSSLLGLDPARRPTAAQALQMPMFQDFQDPENDEAGGHTPEATPSRPSTGRSEASSAVSADEDRPAGGSGGGGGGWARTASAGPPPAAIRSKASNGMTAARGGAAQAVGQRPGSGTTAAAASGAVTSRGFSGSFGGTPTAGGWDPAGPEPPRPADDLSGRATAEPRRVAELRRSLPESGVRASGGLNPAAPHGGGAGGGAAAGSSSAVAPPRRTTSLGPGRPGDPLHTALPEIRPASRPSSNGGGRPAAPH